MNPQSFTSAAIGDSKLVYFPHDSVRDSVTFNAQVFVQFVYCPMGTASVEEKLRILFSY